MENEMHCLKNFKLNKISEDQKIHLLIQSISKHQREMSTYNLRISSDTEGDKQVSQMDAVSNLHLHRETNPFYIQFSKISRNQSNPFIKLID